jgi:hypothetical protein
MNITVLTFSPEHDRDIFSIVSKISLWACASREEVYDDSAFGLSKGETGSLVHRKEEDQFQVGLLS